MNYDYIFLALILASLIVVYIDLFFPKVTSYNFKENKVESTISFVVLSDLHGRKGLMSENKSLQKIRECRPDFILLAGDMITTRQTVNYEDTISYLDHLSKIAPVFYGLGNHEQKAMVPSSKYYPEGQYYFNKLKEKSNITVLDNVSIDFESNGTLVQIHGLTLPQRFFIKNPKVIQEEPNLNDFLSQKDSQNLNILLAHHPKYMKEYVKWGADYIFCGHYHGGIVRLPFLGGVISPEFQLFPKYSGGHYLFNEQHGIVSRGIGIHTFPIRFLNRSQIIHVKLSPNVEKKD